MLKGDVPGITGRKSLQDFFHQPWVVHVGISYKGSCKVLLPHKPISTSKKSEVLGILTYLAPVIRTQTRPGPGQSLVGSQSREREAGMN